MIIIPGQSGTYPHLRGLFQARLEVTVTVQMPEHIALFGFIAIEVGAIVSEELDEEVTTRPLAAHGLVP